VKVLVANNMEPFVHGGAEELATHLVANLERHGVEAEVMRIPFRYDPYDGVPQQVAMVRALELFNADRLIALKFPVYALRHPDKVVWLLHQFRQAYDLFDAGLSHIPDDEHGARVRRIIASADVEALQESRAVYTNSSVTTERLLKYNGIPSFPVPPPLNDPELFTGGEAEGYVFAGGRVNSMKRQRMLVEALARTAANVRLVIAGPPESEKTEPELRELADRLEVADRLTLDLRFLSRHEVAGLVNAASACAYLPFDEDSLGYVAMEAAQAGKAIITTSDSGGVLGLVEEGSTGWVCEPEPEDLARALTAAVSDSGATRRRGARAAEHWRSLGITWDATIERLLS
jgi:glycosyltransferase involved in cell wall biosynthesis